MDRALWKAALAVDWLVGDYAPTFLELARLEDHAAILKRLGPMILVGKAEQDRNAFTTRGILVEKHSRNVLRDVTHRRRGSPPNSGLPFEDPVLRMVQRAVSDAGVPPLEFVDEIWSVADGAAEIAVGLRYVSGPALGETRKRLQSELTALLA